MSRRRSPRRPGATCASVPRRPGRDQRRELRGRGDRDGVRRRVRGQRPHVHDAARGADHGDGDREGLPNVADLEVMLQLLPRSSTGERMNPYTSLWSGVTAGDGPRAFHLVLLDNGRTNVLADAVGRQALAASAARRASTSARSMSRVGGHAYGSTYPGPIGAILDPAARGPGARGPRCPCASSLCGACDDVCPVKIDIPRVLIHLRGRVVSERSGRRPERIAMAGLARVFASRRRYESAQRAIAPRARADAPCRVAAGTAVGVDDRARAPPPARSDVPRVVADAAMSVHHGIRSSGASDGLSPQRRPCGRRRCAMTSIRRRSGSRADQSTARNRASCRAPADCSPGGRPTTARR